jgi:general secretion pathway protein J
MLHKKAGFTLVEVLVASTLGTFIALVAVSALRAISSSARRVTSNIDASAEVRYATDLIAADLMNLYRDDNAENMKFVGSFEEIQDGTTSILTLYTVERVNARADQPEGDVYEAEYFLLRDEDQGQSSLCRRLWPYPERDIEPGGVVIPIARNIEVFQVRFFDGQEWYEQWPEEMRYLPELVEVTVAAVQSDRDDLVVASFITGFARMATGQAAAMQDDQVEGGSPQSGRQGETEADQGDQGQRGSVEMVR